MEKNDLPNSDLKFIQNILDENDFETVFHTKTESQPFSILEVLLTSFDETKDHVFSLNVHYVNEVAEAFGAIDESEDIQLLEFLIQFPEVIRPEFFAEVARLILSLNRLLPVGSFGLSESNQAFYFQYTLGLENTEISEVVLLEVIHMIHFFVDDFAPNIAAVGDGRLNREDYLKGFEEMGLVNK